MKLTKKKKNKLIETWKKYYTHWCKKVNKKQLLRPHEVKEKLKDFAQQQLEQIEQTRPDKTRTAEDQANEVQLEFINYIKYVLQTGEL